ncbi:Crp/Fnr family transcriptional regulator [Spirosoma sp. SC4-14]|uniref:Crp/Fnr family transcriptional regulator n=1 Tax=Spirosoma sp. SC4-14 TaxID=3128900 RepID=UPI0030CE3224
MNKIEETLRSYILPLTDLQIIDQNLIDYLCQKALFNKYLRGENIIKAGELCEYILIIQKGFVRRYSLIEGLEITQEFAKENEMITSMYSLVTNLPSLDYIEAIENSEIIKLKFKDLEKIQEISKQAFMISRLLRDKYFLNLEKRILSFQLSSAKDRYNEVLEKKPYLLQRAPLNQIASYLGITQETLSRIRNKR